LSEGVHTITLTADDGRGGVASASVRVAVVATLAQLPPIPDAVAVAPTLLVFDPAGTTSAAVAIDNQNAAHAIAWSAVADQAWLQMSANAGMTPDEITVSFDGTGLAPGYHQGKITFTSDAVPGATRSIDVQVTIPGVITTPTPTDTPRPSTGTPASPTPTRSRTATETVKPNPTVTPGNECLGDCDRDGAVTIDEIITGVNIALDSALLGRCPVFDGSDDGAVTVDEIITAVTYALVGCPAPMATLTPTLTVAVMTPTLTPTMAAMTSTPTPTVAVITSTPTRSVSPTQSATPTLTLATPTRTSPSQATLTPTGTPGGSAHYCSEMADQVDIPDGDPFGIGSVILIDEPLTINRLKITVWIEHSWVGDLLVTLTRLDDLTTLTLIDRPGYPGSMFGCGEHDILCELVDESTVPAEDECGTDPAALAGSLQPEEPLATFNGGELAGAWQLGVADLSEIDTGRLIQWCIDAY
jgi:hypothetical protein